MDKKRKVDMIYRMIIAGLLAIMAFSAWQIGMILWEYHKGTATYEETQKIANGAGVAEEQIDFAALRKKNPDIRAWLYSEDTNIDYPVVQTTNNEKYLTRMFDLQWNGCGCLFIDCRCEKPFEDFKTIIYGHRMKDGSMFGNFGKYRKQKYFDSHKEFIIQTEGQNYKAELFAVITIHANSKLFETQPKTESEKEEFLGEIQKINTIRTNLDVSPRDNILMLSTCTYEFENARLVLCGKLTRL